MAQKLVRILATRSGRDIALALATEDGRTTTVLATEEQVDRLVDELEDLLNSPAEPDDPEAA